MIKIYGLPSCPDCAFIEQQIKGNDNYSYVDIGANVKDLHDFLTLRDSNHVFDEVKDMGAIGIPCFVKEDGSITLKASEVGLIDRSQSTSCRIDGKGC